MKNCITLAVICVSSLQLIYSGCCNCSEDSKNNEPEGFNDFKEFLKKEETRIIDFIKNDLRNAGINLNPADFYVRYCWTDDILRQACSNNVFKLTFKEYNKLSDEEKIKVDSERNKIDKQLKIICDGLYNEFKTINASGKVLGICSFGINEYKKLPLLQLDIWIFITNREGVVTKEILENAGFSINEKGFIRKVD